MLDAVPGKRIALGVCGGIAAYKVVEVARELTQAGASVHVLMSKAATEFVGEITFSTLTGNPVRTSLFPENAPSQIVHTDLGRNSDLIVIAPATARILSTFAQGQSEDLISALCLSASCPVLMAPAMHTEMWMNEATQSNVRMLEERGVTFVGPTAGALAGPDVGIGRLAEPAEILRAVNFELKTRSSLDGETIVITAGGTREPIDAVRYLGNHSSGLMGYALARAALRRGAKVKLISAARGLVAPASADLFLVDTAVEMRDAVFEALSGASALIMNAAVADWTPAVPATGKLKKADGPPNIPLVPSPDILAETGARRAEFPLLKAVVGFAAETGNLAEAALAKRKLKGADLIVANQVGDQDGFGTDSVLAVAASDEGIKDLGLMPKRSLADWILEELTRLLVVKKGDQK